MTVSKKKETAKEPKKAAKKETEKGPSDADIADRIAAMQKKQQSRQEIEDLKKKLAALATADTRGEDAAPDAPIGMPDGTGDQVGPSHLAWLQAYLKQQWAFSKYQAERLDLEAEVHIVYDEKGRLVDYKFLEKSG
ncbi:MAG: TonB C-terminal domain-containing protein, partial [Desulfuromonadales bacterium]|nr:TonB C-terminal domain-containing protein [Desulfuromonadales bacterium]NIS44276.1 TonB C-terminal domain-containing protein [Desulfuromonadales bacterium]